MNQRELMRIIETNSAALQIVFNTLKILKVISEKEILTEPTIEEEDFEVFAVKFINCWKQLPRECSMGTGNSTRAKIKLRKYLTETGASQETVLKAVKSYLTECMKFNRKARYPEYFIMGQNGKAYSTDSDLYGIISQNLPEQQDLSIVSI